MVTINRPADRAIEQAIELAAELLKKASELQTPEERRQQAELDRMIQHQADKATLVEMTDQAFRTHSSARVADQLTHLLDIQGVPRFFSPVEQAMLRGFQSFGEYLPGVAVPLVKEKMRRETANVIMPAEPELLSEHLRNRQSTGTQMNVNLLGEAVLGQREARDRMRQYVEALRLDDVRCVSVKISTIYSQVSSLARRHTVKKVCDRLETLYRTADLEIDRATGLGKFVYLDMEEYRDLYLTADALCQTLDRPGLEQTRAGIALQAYIPDSHLVMQRLLSWSADRVAKGRTPLTIRLVKGANLEMERVESSIGGHAQAPYQSKLETDANFKRMLYELTEATKLGNARVGLASHNLFDVALGLIWAGDLAATDAIQIEMLEGMANHQRRAISGYIKNMLLYAPACRRDGFLNAIGYLIRRLDENTGPQNFLRHTYRLKPDSEDFRKLASDFTKSLQLAETVSNQPRRSVDRHVAPVQPPAAPNWEAFVNEPDTDWAVPANSNWAQSILDQWETRCDDRATEVRLHVGDQLIAPEHTSWSESMDPSRPGKVICRYQVANRDHVFRAAGIAHDHQSTWAATSIDQRHELLRKTAQLLRERRDDLIGAMVADGGKTIPEADPEISEAIDFCEFYPLTVRHWDSRGSVRLAPRGTVAVITPWNFPLAIACGGIAAALAAGNTVILKPASETILTAAMVCQAFWDAGVSREALQMVPCQDEDAEAGLVINHQIDTVILTGGTQTAKRMLAVRPGLHLLAETGGKNATIVTAMADRDLAIKHVLHSAFGHSGQKCSATSLLLLEREIFEDESFRATLEDAVNSLEVGSAWELSTKMGPLIGPPGDMLARGMKSLEDDETWLCVPEQFVDDDEHPSNIYRPGVKWNIQPEGFSHLTELFGPVLGVMPFSRLEEAIEIVRRTGYGLTSGLESLDDREIDLWKQSIHAGNLYINRPTTGAIVLRQPFGGVGLSAYGPGVKAGGPHYVLALMRIVDGDPAQHSAQHSAKDQALDRPADDEPANFAQVRSWLTWLEQQNTAPQSTLRQWTEVTHSAATAMESEFGREHDTFRLVGQDNIRRYRPVKAMTLRIEIGDSIADAVTATIAGVMVQTQITVSMNPELDPSTKAVFEAAADRLPGWVQAIDETDGDLADRIRQGELDRLRLLHHAVDDRSSTLGCAEHFVTIIDEPVLRDARIECLRYLDEQSISHEYHRYGNMGRRSDETRAPVA